MRARHYFRMSLPVEPPSRWDVYWQAHNSNIDLYNEPGARGFMIRAQVTRESVGHLQEVVNLMAQILNLGPPPAPPNPFAWPELPDTWTDRAP